LYYIPETHNLVESQKLIDNNVKIQTTI